MTDQPLSTYTADTDAAEKLATAQAFGSVVLARASVANVANIDLSLPSGYGSFDLILSALEVDALDPNSGPILLFSADAGVTWINGSSDYRVMPIGSAGENHAYASIGNFTGGYFFAERLTIFPGGADAYASLQAAISVFYEGDDPDALVIFNSLFAEGAVNKLRLQSQGDGTTPPAGPNLVSANYTLIGYA